MATTTTTETRYDVGTAGTTAQLIFQAPLPAGVTASVNINSNNADGTPESNFSEEKHTVQVHNIRKLSPADYGVDVTGFGFYKAPTALRAEDFADDEVVKGKYYDEVRAILLRKLGAREVYIFDHTIRRRNPGVADDDPSRRQPVSRVHIDQTPKAAIARVVRHMGARADALLEKRWQLINVWRPIAHAAEDHPLALADYKSIDASRDLVPTRLVYPAPIPEGEVYNVLHADHQKYYYVKAQQTDEVTLIKCFDSDDSVARLTPHTAFRDPNSHPGAPLRQSIEVRCLVFY